MRKVLTLFVICFVLSGGIAWAHDRKFAESQEVRETVERFKDSWNRRDFAVMPLEGPWKMQLAAKVVPWATGNSMAVYESVAAYVTPPKMGPSVIAYNAVPDRWPSDRVALSLPPFSHCSITHDKRSAGLTWLWVRIAPVDLSEAESRGFLLPPYLAEIRHTDSQSYSVFDEGNVALENYIRVMGAEMEP